MVTYIKLTLLLLGVLIAPIVRSQSIRQYFLYSHNRSIFNPAEAGAENKPILSLNGVHFNYGSQAATGIISYEGPAKALHGGIGATMLYTDEKAYRFSKLGIAYSYLLNIDESKTIRLGVRPTLSSSKFYDESPSTYANLDFGGYLSSNGFYIGIWALNSINFVLNERLELPSVSVLLGKEIQLGNSVVTDPSLAFSLDKADSFLALNNNLRIKGIFIFGTTLVLNLAPAQMQEPTDVSINAGVNLFQRVELIGMVWSSRFKDFVKSEPAYFEGVIRVKLSK